MSSATASVTLKDFRLVKMPGGWKHGEIPDCFEPIEFGRFFISYSKS